MRELYVDALKSFVENGHVQEALEPEYLIGELKTKGVISQAEADGILAKNSRLVRQKELLLDILPKREDAAFDSLLETMDSELYHWARSMLQAIVNREVKQQKRLHQE